MNMRPLLVLIACVFACAMGQAQDQTRAQQGMNFMNSSEKILVVPFEPKMLISDIHPPMCIQNQMEGEELISVLQTLVMEQLLASQQFNMIGQDEGDWIPEQLNQRFRYKYLNAPVLPCQGEEPASRKEKETSKKPRTGLVRGEVVADRAVAKKYMLPVIDASIMKEVMAERNADYLCVITEMDFRFDHYASVNPGQAPMKKISLHFAFFNADGNVCFSGIVSESTDTKNYQLGALIQDYIGPLCDQIMDCFKTASQIEEPEGSEEITKERTSSKNRVKKPIFSKTENDDEDF
ncbi:MAG: hypothetical protein ACPGED_06480 [Flavobacteriales bacterium]